MLNKTALITLAVIVAAVGVAQARTRYLAPLTGAGKGKAKFDQRVNEAQLEVEAERLARNAAHTVRVGSMAPVPVATDAFGRLVYNRRFGRTGQPVIGVGTPVSIRNGAGTVVLSGTFAVN